MFAVAPEKKRSILRAISVQGKKLHTTDGLHLLEELAGGIYAVKNMP